MTDTPMSVDAALEIAALTGSQMADDLGIPEDEGGSFVSIDTLAPREPDVSDNPDDWDSGNYTDAFGW